MSQSYTKPPKTFQEQLEIWKDRGLMVDDEAFACHCLSHLNYYRLSAYRFPLSVQGNPDQFLPGTSFSDLWILYHFDRTLRRLILDACKRVEISVRTQWAYVLAHQYGAQSYEDSQFFSNSDRLCKNLSKLDDLLQRSTEDFVLHFRRKYEMERPPIWAVCEVLSFGLVSHFFQNLKERSIRQKIAAVYRLDEKILASFLHHLTTVRNHAAHHARIWNRKFVVKLIIPKRPFDLRINFTAIPSNERHIYNTLIMLIYMMQIIEPHSHWSKTVIEHIKSLPPKYLPDMGFPANWEERPIWRDIMDVQSN
ncbi:Abi family protein [Candidatus Sumerlaeota bacterium]|nr:Abi family protein [Candidatus Sumerlaeota bacterium]